MDDRIRYMLLKLLSTGGNVDSLEKSGYQYAQIASAYSQIINEQLIVLDNKQQFVLSDIGYEELKKLADKMKDEGIWKIEPYIKYKIEKMDKYDIFIE